MENENKKQDAQTESKNELITLEIPQPAKLIAMSVENLEKTLEKAIEMGKRTWILTTQILGSIFAQVDKKDKSKKIAEYATRFQMSDKMIYRYLKAYKGFKDGVPQLEAVSAQDYIDKVKENNNAPEKPKATKMLTISKLEFGNGNIVLDLTQKGKTICHFIATQCDKDMKPKAFKMPEKVALEYTGKTLLQVKQGQYLRLAYKVQSI